jgi:hypothetical protein
VKSRAYQLFHKITDPECVQTRKWISENGLLENVQFRNVTTGEEALSDLIKWNPESQVPTLLEIGTQEIYVGFKKISERLKKVR